MDLKTYEKGWGVNQSDFHKPYILQFTPSMLMLFYFIIVIIISNVSALVDMRLHPEIPYFDEEHLIVGGITGLTCLVLFSVISYYSRQIHIFAKKSFELSRRLEYLKKNANDIILLVDKSGNIVDANDRATTTYGYTEEQITMLNIRNLYPHEKVREVDNQLNDIGEHEGLIFETEHRHSNGTAISVEISSKLLEIDGQKFYQFIIRDITERKRAVKNLMERESQLNELNTTKDKFFSIIAHDLKNPFNSILGFSNYLVEQVHEKNYEGIEEYATIIQNSSQRAMDLLLNLLVWARSQTGRVQFNPDYIEIVGLINEVIDLFNCSAKQKSITILSELPNDIRIFADKAMINTILRNLLSNAIKFTNRGGQIIISSEQNNGELLVSVRDNGIGIKNDAIDKLFRIDQSRSTPGTNNEEGTGLGLILCKEFIAKHGGRIWVESEPGRGSKFCFTIPEKQQSESKNPQYLISDIGDFRL